MGRTISQRELRMQSGAIMRAVEAGESFTVTRNGVPLAELTPARRRVFVPRDDVLASGASLAVVDLARLREDMDRLIDPGLEPRV